MHIPDGFLDLKTSAVTAGLALAGLAVALRHARATLEPRKMPLLGLSAAFVFAAQMVNFPVLAGTSGHLVGGVLTAAVLGPSAAVIVLSTVLIVQCLAFADGGITALGANVFNMGIVGGVGGWMVYAVVARMLEGVKGRIVAAVVASWVSVVAAAVVCAGELAASGTAAWKMVLPGMAAVHAVIGVGEGIITALVLAAVAASRRELVLPAPPTERRVAMASVWPVVAYGVLAAVGIGMFVAPWGSRAPDGLEMTAEKLGFEGKAVERGAPLAGYEGKGISSAGVATGVAGAVGTVGVFVLGLVMARVLVQPNRGTS